MMVDRMYVDRWRWVFSLVVQGGQEQKEVMVIES
jgi:hypothetical protein